MQISKRLQTVAGMVTRGNKVADIGCDHAYISCYLIDNNISNRVIAMDINQGPIERAKENIIRFGYSEKIEIRKSDGLKKLKKDEVDSVVIAGMGGALIIKILSDRMDIVNNVRELILQPQSEIHKVRKKLEEFGFLIVQENMVKEDGKYYVSIKARPSKEVLNHEKYHLDRTIHFYYGKLLLNEKHPILYEFLEQERLLNEMIYKKLKLEDTEQSRLRMEDIVEKLNLIQQGITNYL